MNDMYIYVYYVILKKQKGSLSLPIFRRCTRDVLLVCVYMYVYSYVYYKMRILHMHMYCICAYVVYYV